MKKGDLMLRQVKLLYKKHHTDRSLISGIVDPIYSQLYVQQIKDQKFQLPSIKQRSKTEQYHFLRKSRKQRLSTIKQRSVRYNTLDTECTLRFSQQTQQRRKLSESEQKKRKKFIEIDILTLQTNYVKSSHHKQGLKGQKNNLIKKLPKVPTKQRLSEFIRNYTLTNQELNIDDLVRRQNFAVQFEQETSLYFGDIKEEKRDGKGVFITKNYIFEGQWILNQKFKGIEITPKGIFRGKFNRNERSKVGQFFWFNGQHYSGEWLNNKKHGKGVWRSSKGDIYMGQWSNGKVQGYGTHLCKSGQKYEGYFENFLKHGEGKEHFSNGDYFQGSFKEGKPEGLGFYKWKNGITYEGYFLNGYREGRGKISNNDIFYEGTFHQQKAHGEGRLQIGHKKSYQGSFKNGKKQGKGIQRNKRKIFVGLWQNNIFLFKN